MQPTPATDRPLDPWRGGVTHSGYAYAIGRGRADWWEACGGAHGALDAPELIPTGSHTRLDVPGCAPIVIRSGYRNPALNGVPA